MGTHSSKVEAVALAALRNGQNVDAAVSKYRKDNGLDSRDNLSTVVFWRVQYSNRADSGTHWGKPYKTERGARKNGRNERFIRAVKFQSAS